MARPKTALRIIAVVGALIGAAPSALAQSSDDDRKARELYLVGDNHYAAGRYEQALLKFEQAYMLSKRPQLLYNIANAYERMGDYEKAADYLRRYLESPEAEDVSSVRERIRRLEMNADAQGREPQPERVASPAAVSAAATAPRTRADDPGARRWLRRPAYMLIAGGGAALATAFVFGLGARSAAADAKELCDTNGLCPESASDEVRRERTFALVSDITAVLGLASASVGVYLLVRDHRASEKARAGLRVEPRLYDRAAGIGLAGDF
jgi:tetratricopeptide (TPR) repeat protein